MSAIATAQEDAVSRQPLPPTAGRRYEAASVLAEPGLECKVYPAGQDPDKAARVHTDSDGYARFYSIRAASTSAVRELALDCVNRDGKASSYTADLASDQTFAPRNLRLEDEPGIDRPALTGDPLAWSQQDLLQAGYGLRPDPVSSPDAYRRWLTAATLPGRILTTRHTEPQASSQSSVALLAASAQPAHPASGEELEKPVAHVQTVHKQQDPYWTGTILSGKPNYISVEGNLSVPSIVVNGDETQGKDVHVAVWNGLGGTVGSGLIQGGYQIDVDNSVVSYFTFREYCCGDADSNGYSGDFNLKAGDTLYSQEWYCDKNGNLNLNGGYGCTHLHDLTSGAVLDCSSASNKNCWSVKANPLCSVSPKAPGCMIVGQSAEAVIELQGSLFWPDLGDTVTITGSAYSDKTKSYSQTVNSDPVLTYDTDFTGMKFVYSPPSNTIVVPESPSHMSVSTGSQTQTYFNVSQFKQVAGLAHPGSAFQSIAAGPNAQGSTLGDAWSLGINANSSGDYNIYRWQEGADSGSWVEMPGEGVQIADGPAGYPWLVNHAGVVFYWNGSAWDVAPGNACASHIAVGPNSGGTKYGTAWTLGCHEGANGYNIYKLEGSAWVQQPGQATQIAIGNTPWIVQKSGAVFWWNGSEYVQVLGSVCATSIAAAPIDDPFENVKSDIWITGCHELANGYSIYQLQDNEFVQIPGNATQISVSPDHGIPWIVDKQGNIYE